MKRRKYTRQKNIHLTTLINELKKASNQQNVKIWKTIAKILEKSTRRKRTVNLSKIDKYVRKDEIALVPGKVLSMGNLTKDIKVAAYQFSEKAKEKIKNKLSIQELMKINPKGKKIRIIG